MGRNSQIYLKGQNPQLVTPKHFLKGFRQVPVPVSAAQVYSFVYKKAFSPPSWLW